jgi:hypothetical protein
VFVGIRVSVGVFVTVGVLVRVGVFVGVEVKVGITQPVRVGGRVCVDWISLSTGGVAVQVGGRERRVAVLVGSSIRAGMVGGGKGLSEEFGSIAIWANTTTRQQMLTKPTMERISQTLEFMQSSRESLQICLSVSIAEKLPLSSTPRITDLISSRRTLHGG